MNRREIPPLHEIAKLELQFRLLFFLRDLGIKSAHTPAKEVWEVYMNVLSELTVGG
jgi:hypothetical protein